MRPSLSRSLVAAASLAVASAALVSTPANASGPSAAVTPAGVTRDMVLTAAAGFRNPTEATYPAALRAILSIAGRSCGVTPDNAQAVTDIQQYALAGPSSADGVILRAEITDYSTGIKHECMVGAVAAVAPGFNLTGTATLNVVTQTPPPELPFSIAAGPATLTTPLSGDVATTVFHAPQGERIFDGTFSANGSAVHVEKTTTSRKVADKKSKAQKKAAKATYDKRIKAAKKSYEKALKKAGSSKSKKAVAKKLYAEKKARAKAAYKYAIANYKLVKKTTTKTDSRPFSLTTPML